MNSSFTIDVITTVLDTVNHALCFFVPIPSTNGFIINASAGGCTFKPYTYPDVGVSSFMNFTGFPSASVINPSFVTWNISPAVIRLFKKFPTVSGDTCPMMFSFVRIIQCHQHKLLVVHHMLIVQPLAASCVGN